LESRVNPVSSFEMRTWNGYTRSTPVPVMLNPC
jgi:hypothetical protein